eukprot:UN18403
MKERKENVETKEKFQGSAKRRGERLENLGGKYAQAKNDLEQANVEIKNLRNEIKELLEDKGEKKKILQLSQSHQLQVNQKLEEFKSDQEHLRKTLELKEATLAKLKNKNNEYKANRDSLNKRIEELSKSKKQLT